MLLLIPDVLTPAELSECRRVLDAPAAPWADGKITAGPAAAKAKDNLQLREATPESEALGLLVLRALERCGPFLSCALPLKIYPPLFNRYEAAAGHGFKAHTDNTFRQTPSGERVRCDLSATLFLSDPADYDGGELVIEEASAERSVKLPAGHLVLYESGTLHRVEPVTRGTRTACVFWTQSMVRGAEQRELLAYFDASLQSLGRDVPDRPELKRLLGLYHNLLRMWGDS